METRRSSVAGIAAEGGRVFIARRVEGGDLGGKWEFPGGKVEEGESDREALIREFREEFGVDIQTGPMLGSAVFTHHGKDRLLRAYRVFFSSPDITLLEHTEYRWADLDEIRRLDFAGSDLLLLPALEVSLGGEARVQDHKTGAGGIG